MASLSPDYLFIVCTHGNKMLLDQWLKSNKSEGVWSLKNDFYIYSLNASAQSFVHGYSIDCEGRRITIHDPRRKASNYILSNSAKHNLTGCFIGVNIMPEKIIVSGDLFRQKDILFFSNSEIIVVSSSLYLLTEARKALRLSNALEEEACSARETYPYLDKSNSLGFTPISHRAQVKSIYYCHVGACIEILLFEQKLKTSIQRQSLNSIFELKDSLSYYETIHKCSKDFIELFLALNEYNCPLICQITGGYDSRVVTSSLVRANEISPNKNINYYSNPKREEFKTAQNFAAHIGFNLNTKRQGFESIYNFRDELSHFGANNFYSLGMYDVITTQLNVKKFANTIKLTGHGAGALKGKWGAQSVKQKWGEVDRESFWNELSLGMDSIGVELDHPLGAELHNLAFRNALHPGRNHLSSISIMPLLNKDLVSLAFSKRNIHPLPSVPGKSNIQMNIVKDLLIAQGTKFTSSAFYKAPSFSEEQINNFLQSAICPEQLIKTDDYTPYDLHNELGDIPVCKYSEIAISIIQNSLFSGIKDMAMARDIAVELSSRMPEGIRGDYLSRLESFGSIEDQGKMINNNPWYVACIGRGLSYSLFD